MILLKSAIPSLLVVFGACQRASGDSSQAPGIDAGALVVDPGAVPPSIARAGGPSPVAAKTLYVCPMHPEVVSDTPGLCPKCNMKLDPKPQATEVSRSNARAGAPNRP